MAESNKYTTDEIADYLNGTAEPAKAAIIKLAAETDSELAAEIEEQRNLSRVVQIAALKKKLAVIHKEFETETTAPQIFAINQKKERKLNWPLLALAAAVTGIILFIAVFKSGQSYNTRLFNKYFSDDTGAPSLMGNSATPFDQAMVYYKAGDYQKASENFEQLLQKAPANDTLKFYEALSLVRISKDEKALILLGNVHAPEGGELLTKTKWYLALIYLKQGRKKESIPILTAVEKSNSSYAGKAASLKKELVKERD